MTGCKADRNTSMESGSEEIEERRWKVELG